MKAIVFGYPGIGKSTLARNCKDFIDLESSVFKIDGERDLNWFKVYVNMAIHIANQERIVFMSTHPWTRDYIAEMKDLDIPVLIVYPDVSLKDFWDYKVSIRYTLDPTEKNLTALNKVKSDYEKDIKGLEADTRFPHLVLKDQKYRLDDEIKEYLFKLSLNNSPTTNILEVYAE